MAKVEVTELEFKRFQREFYPDYVAWFVDPDLNHALGPMDTDWLEAILALPEAEGAIWAVFQGNEMVAVIGTAFDAENNLPVGITELAVKPGLRQHGLGTAVLRKLLSRHHAQGFTEHIAFVDQNNLSGQRCSEKAGFRRVSEEPNEHGYHTYRHTYQSTNPTQ